MKKYNLTRRNFLQQIGALGSLATVGSLVPTAFAKLPLAKSIEEMFKPIVGTELEEFLALVSAKKGILSGAHWGMFEGVVQNNKLVKVYPLADDPDPNELITMAPFQVHAKNRIKYPYIRKSWLESHKNGAVNRKTDLRGKDEWVRVSWDEAIDIVSSELIRVQKNFGPGGIHAANYGWKSVGMFHNSRIILYRLLNLFGGFVGGSGDYSTGAAQVMMGHVVGSMEVYEQQTAWDDVLENTELVVLWGCDPSITLKNSWNLPDHIGNQGFKLLAQKKVPTVSINPVQIDTAKDLTAEWLKVKPATDEILLLALCHTLYKENLHDKKFLAKYTVGYDQFEKYLSGALDGIEKTPQWAADICGIPAQTIIALARRMAKHRTMIMGGWSVQRKYYGEQSLKLMVTLASMLGQIGLPGGGFGFSYHYSSGGSPTAKGGILAGLSPISKLATYTNTNQAPKPIPVAKIADCIANPGKTINFNGEKVTYTDVRMLWVAGGNPIHHHQDINNFLKILQRLETIIVQDPYWTATAKHADIVLPATTTYERNDMDMGGDYSQMYVFPLHQLVTPQHEAKNDFDIARLIAAKLGKEAEFTENKTEMEWLSEMYEKMAVSARNSKVALPRFEDFWRSNNYIKFPVPESSRKFVRHADFRENPLLNPLGTPSGKIEIFSKTIDKFDYKTCPALPIWLQPHEWYGTDLTKKYPFALISPHPNNRLHSQLDNTPYRDKFAIANREPALINPQDAKLRGIKHGDLIEVFNDRGQILVGANVSKDIMPGVIRIFEGAWYDKDPSQPTRCRNGCVNLLTSDIGTSELAQATAGAFTFVDFRKYQGTPPENTAHKVPKGAV